MKKNFVFILIVLFSILILCGAASAATVKSQHLTSATIGKADLKQVSLKVVASGSYIVKIGIKNQGTRTSKSFTSNLHIGNYAVKVNYGPVNPGKTVYGTVILNTALLYKYKIGLGIHKFTNVVDPQNRIPESNEKNNVQSELAEIEALIPYLQVVDLDIDPKSAVTQHIHVNDKIYYNLPLTSVYIIVKLKNISGHNLKKISIGVGTIPNHTGIINGNLTTWLPTIMKPGEIREFTIPGDILIAGYELNPLTANVKATGLDMINVPGYLAERQNGHKIPNAFIPE